MSNLSDWIGGKCVRVNRDFPCTNYQGEVGLSQDRHTATPPDNYETDAQEDLERPQ